MSVSFLGIFESFVLLLLLFTGIWLTIRLEWMPLRHPLRLLQATVGGMFREKREGKRFSAFAAAATSLAGTMGTGNIVGVAAAIAAGGAGAVFWMIVGAVFGMCTKYAEILLGFRYRKKNEKDEYRGGPMYYLSDGLGWHTMAKCFAVLCAACGLGVGNLTQVNAAVSAVQSVTAGAVPGWVTGMAMGIICLIILSGGNKRLGKVTSFLMPVLSIGYLIGCLWIIWLCRSEVGYVICEIVSSAFSLRSAVSGGVGYGILRSMRYGLARGVFSHEAGMGSAPIVHAEASDAEPHTQGLWGAFEVFWDTIVGCTATALVILLAMRRPEWRGMTGFGADWIGAIFAIWFGEAGRWFIDVSLVLFAMAAMISWWMYGDRAVEFLGAGKYKAGTLYLLSFLSFAVLGGVLQSETIWEIADLLNCCMVLPNLLALFWLFEERGDPLKKEKRR